MVQVTLENEWLRQQGICVPAAKVITITFGVFGLSQRQCIALLAQLIRSEEFRGYVGSTLAVLVEHQPVAVCQLLHKGEVPFDFDMGSVGINVVFCVSFHKVCVTFRKKPTFEICIGIGRDVSFVDGIILHDCVIEEV